MSKVKITINVTDPKQNEALIAFLNVIKDANPESKKEVEQVKDAAVAAIDTPLQKERRSRAKKDENTSTLLTAKPIAYENTPEQVTEEIETPEEESAGNIDETREEDSAIKVEDLRVLLSQKVDKHRVDIKAKLTEFGANNIGTLDKEHYQAMKDFFNSLD